MRRIHCLVASLTTMLACGCDPRGGPSPEGSGAPAASGRPEAPASAPGEGTPDGVVTRYLEVGASGDLTKLKDLVDPKCYATKVGAADAVTMLGARMTLTSATAKVESQQGDTATVSYSVKGSIDAKEARAETDIFGKRVEIHATGMTMTGLTQSGTLTVKKIDGRWVVTC